MNKKRYPIQGMHCRSCEVLIEERLTKIPGVQKAEVNHKRGYADVWSEQEPAIEHVESAVRSAGYALGSPQKRLWFSRDPVDYFELLVGFSIVFLLFILGKAFGVFNVSSSVGSSVSMGLAVVIGLTAGVSSCMALIGGLVLGISARHATLHPEASAGEKLHPHIFFNLGRIMGFGLLGGIIGVFGSLFQISVPVLGGLIMAAGFVMLFLGLKLIAVFPRFSSLTITLPKLFARKAAGDRREYSHTSAFTAGVLTFFLPCGFTQAMQVYAISTGSFIQGALVMALFALGTAPGLLGIGTLASFMRGMSGRIFFKSAGIVVVALGILNLSNGFNLTGIVLGTSGPGTASQLQNGEQIVKITQDEYGYEPNAVTVKKDIPVRLIVEATNPFNCSIDFVIPKLGIRKFLDIGTNEFTFTPKEAGPIRFSCSMGMYSGKINVIN